MRRFIAVAVVMVPLLLDPPGLAAQAPRIGLAGGWFAPGGADFDDTDAGAGVQISVRWVGSGALTWGGGVHWSTHEVDFTDDAYDVVGLFLEPRLEAGGEGKAAPFVAAQAAWLRESIRVGASHRSATGLGVGGLVGVAVRLGGRASLEAAVGGIALRFGDFTANGVSLPDTESAGRSWSFRLGLVFAP